MTEQTGPDEQDREAQVADSGGGPTGRESASSASLTERLIPSGARVAEQVEQFHRAYELPLRSVPTPEIGAAQVTLRQALIEEEVAELAAAAHAGDLVGIADALADIVYVAYGTALVYGIDLDAVVAEVHASNMTKLGADGRPVHRDDGKVLKGPEYRPPDIAAVLRKLVDDVQG